MTSSHNGVDPTTYLDNTQRIVEQAEKDLIWDAFQELKALGGTGELRITVETDSRTKQAEVIYVGLHKRKALDSLRRRYVQRRDDVLKATKASSQPTGAPA